MKLAPLIIALVLAAFATSNAQAQETANFRAYRAAVESNNHAEVVRLLRAIIAEIPASSPDAGQMRMLYTREIVMHLLADGRLREAIQAADRCTSMSPGRASEVRLACEYMRSEARAQLRALESPPAPAVAQPPPPVTVTISRPTVQVTPTPVQSWRPAAGPIALWSVGAGSLAVASVLYALRASALAPCEQNGGRVVCQDAASLERARDSVALTQGANVALGIGVTAAVAGTAWWLFGGRAVVPTVSDRGVNVAFVGTW